MYNENTQDLCHHGIKGQKWGIVNKKDDAQSRVASEKNRLNYDKNIAGIEANANVENNRIKQENKTDRYQIRSDAKTSLALGRQQIAEVLARESTARKESKDELEAKKQKYTTVGTVAVMACFAAMSIGRHVAKSMRK